jgi:hypothetical protein
MYDIIIKVYAKLQMMCVIIYKNITRAGAHANGLVRGNGRSVDRNTTQHKMRWQHQQ